MLESQEPVVTRETKEEESRREDDKEALDLKKYQSITNSFQI